MKLTNCGAGEFGTTFTTSDDMEWIHDFAEWRNNIAPANDGLHNAVNSYFYWRVFLLQL